MQAKPVFKQFIIFYFTASIGQDDRLLTTNNSHLSVANELNDQRLSNNFGFAFKIFDYFMAFHIHLHRCVAMAYLDVWLFICEIY